MNGIGSRFGSSCSYFMIASGLWPGALGGTRTPNLLIRRSVPSVHSKRWSPYPLVSTVPGVRC
jgi:hypothetical protein